MRNFAGTLRYMIPTFEFIGIGWKEGEQYDEYDRLADSLFRELVLHPATYMDRGVELSYQYDMPPYGADWGCLVVMDKNRGIEGKFIRITTKHTPMDSIIYLHNDDEYAAKISDADIKLEYTDR